MATCGNCDHKRVVAIVQARLGSSRLPMKSLLCLRGLPIIDWVTGRLKCSRKLDRIVVAIPDTELDAVLGEHLERQGIACVTGPENDVLGRILIAARKTEADLVVRVCADNPLIWSGAVDRLVDFYRQNDFDYAYNHIPRGNNWPDGLGAEIVSRGMLEKIGEKANIPSQREHCLNYIWDNAGHFKIGTFDPLEPWLMRPELKLDIDSASDFIRLARMPINPDMDARDLMRACLETSDGVVSHRCSR